MNTGDISIDRRGDKISIGYAGDEFVAELGMGLPIRDSWRWTFDRSLRLVDQREGTGQDSLGEYGYLAAVYSVPGLSRGTIPLLQQELRGYDDSLLLVETKVLEEIRGTFLEDSFYNTTFNSPILLFHKEFDFLAYTWGLMGVESSRDGGHFPEAVTGRGIHSIPSKLTDRGVLAARGPAHQLPEALLPPGPV